MNRSAFFFIVILSFPFLLTAQSPYKVVKPAKSDLILPKPMNRLGFSASTMSGVGLNLLHFFDDKVGARLVLGAYYSETSANQWYFYNSTGLEVQYNVYETKIARFYPLMGLNFRYTEDKYLKNKSQFDKITRNYTLGVGWGIELLIARLVAIHGEVGYHFIRHAQYNYDVNFKSQDLDFIEKNIKFLGFGVGASVAF